MLPCRSLSNRIFSPLARMSHSSFPKLPSSRHSIDISVVTNRQAADVEPLAEHFGLAMRNAVHHLDAALGTGHIDPPVRTKGKRSVRRGLTALRRFPIGNNLRNLCRALGRIKNLPLGICSQAGYRCAVISGNLPILSWLQDRLEYRIAGLPGADRRGPVSPEPAHRLGKRDAAWLPLCVPAPQVCRTS